MDGARPSSRCGRDEPRPRRGRHPDGSSESRARVTRGPCPRWTARSGTRASAFATASPSSADARARRLRDGGGVVAGRVRLNGAEFLLAQLGGRRSPFSCAGARPPPVAAYRIASAEHGSRSARSTPCARLRGWPRRAPRVARGETRGAGAVEETRRRASSPRPAPPSPARRAARHLERHGASGAGAPGEPSVRPLLERRAGGVGGRAGRRLPGLAARVRCPARRAPPRRAPQESRITRSPRGRPRARSRDRAEPKRRGGRRRREKEYKWALVSAPERTLGDAFVRAGACPR